MGMESFSSHGIRQPATAEKRHGAERKSCRPGGKRRLPADGAGAEHVQVRAAEPDLPSGAHRCSYKSNSHLKLPAPAVSGRHGPPTRITFVAVLAVLLLLAVVAVMLAGFFLYNRRMIQDIHHCLD